ncbi:hypothetical protein F511_25346 [Dorcoceras hygrometricum]|uniref:Uncharacterized protein n=1 Tax=Dorcoceras hygrometricum TaxID=472368 RepID=A0A2Z7CMM4_9LAMI|nr:hypothetical protein F511_25346 [Dorcoceras hygrometricum]
MAWWSAPSGEPRLKFLRWCLLRRFTEGLTDLSEVPKNLVFDARSLFSESTEQVSVSCLKKELKIAYRILSDILAKTIYVKEVADAPRVKKTPVKKAVSQNRPAAVDVEVAPVVKKKRTTKGKPVVIAQEAVPFQIIEGTAAVPVEQPPMPKRKIHKRKRRLVLEAEDEIFDDQPAAADATVVEKSPVDEPDVSGAHVEDQPAGHAAERPWFDLPYEDIIAKLNDRPVVTPNDSDEDELIIDAVTKTGATTDCVVGKPLDEEMGNDEVSVNEKIDADVAMSLEDIMLSIPVDVPLPSAGVEITKIVLVQTVYIPGVDEGDWYKASLPKIHPEEKGKEPLQLKDPAKGKPPKENYSLICADIDLLVHLREQKALTEVRVVVLDSYCCDASFGTAFGSLRDAWRDYETSPFCSLLA